MMNGSPKRVLEEEQRRQELELMHHVATFSQFEPKEEDRREITEWLQRRIQRWQNPSTT